MANWRDPDENRDYKLPSRPNYKGKAKDSALIDSFSKKGFPFTVLIITITIATVCFLSTISLFINFRLNKIENIITQIRQEQIKPTSTLLPALIPTASSTPTPTPTPSPDFTSTPVPECSQDLPSPQLALKGIEEFDFGTVYWLTVINHNQFPNEIFAPAPHLSSCGINTNSSRTWIQILGDNRSYTLCVLKSPDDLDELWFPVSRNDIPPSSVHITMVDRECNKSYTSNVLPVP